MGEELNLCLAGASIGNGNRGVEALGRSVLDIIDASTGGARLSVFDDGWGVREDVSGRYRATRVEYVGVRQSRRWHRPESWAQIRVAQTLGGLTNPAAERIAAADAVLDISGGDSFTDMYGRARLKAVAAPKKAALRAKRPLVLLPQTYGPFSTKEGRRVAERLVRESALAYARDTASHERLLELAGPDGDSQGLRNGVDVAFALDPRRPANGIVDRVVSLSGEVVAGVNISGLLRGPEAQRSFGLVGDYVATMIDIVHGLVARGAWVMLVPHVHVPGGGGESDLASIAQVVDALSPQERSRTFTLPAELDAAELKWCMARCSWFIGSRMHSTIAALSSQVPAFGYAYSDKTKGVFETCGMGAHVQDARKVSGPAAVRAVLESFEQREAIRAQLASGVPAVVGRAREQLREILTEVEGWRTAQDSGGASL